MTNQERQEILEKVEKPAHKSKKFVAWLIFQLLMCLMAIYALKTQPELGWPLASYMVGTVVAMGMSTMYFLGKQAALDSSIRGFAILGGAAKDLQEKING